MAERPRLRRSRRYDSVGRDGAVVPPSPSTVDLHTHSTRSDGVLAPVDLVRHIAAAGVRIAALTDLGMTGPVWSVIGFDPATVLPRFINALPTRFEVGDGPVVFNATQIDIDAATGRAIAIERIQRLVEP